MSPPSSPKDGSISNSSNTFLLEDASVVIPKMELKSLSILKTTLLVVTFISVLQLHWVADPAFTQRRELQSEMPIQADEWQAVNDTIRSILQTSKAAAAAAATSAAKGAAATSRDEIPVGTFNGFDMHLVNHPPRTTAHCVGENFQENRSWLFRSCEYKTFCYDVDYKLFVVYRGDIPDYPDHWYTSTQMKRVMTNVVGGSQPKTWFPVIAHDKLNLTTRIGMYRPVHAKTPPSKYYRINATMIPFYRHPTSHRNPGHIQWDEFLPLYTLLDMFDHVGDNLFLSQITRQSTMEFQEPIPTFDLLPKFLPFMLGNMSYDIQIEKGFDLKWNTPPPPPPPPSPPPSSTDNNNNNNTTNNNTTNNNNNNNNTTNNNNNTTDTNTEATVICADYGLTGGGILSDHGENRWHGQTEKDRVYPHNSGRGGLFRRFRNFIMKNLDLNPKAPMNRSPYRIIVSQNSSTKGWRSDMTFDDEIRFMKDMGPDRIDIQSVILSDMPIRDQVKLTSQAAFYITTVGGGTSTAMFLPKGAHLFLYYIAVKPLDWDFWNNFPHIHVHWIPFWKDENGTLINPDVHMKAFRTLLTTELDLLDTMR